MDFTEMQLYAFGFMLGATLTVYGLAYGHGLSSGKKAGYNQGVADSDKHAAARHAAELAHHAAERQRLQNQLELEKGQRQIAEHRLRQDLAQAMEAADKRIAELQLTTEQDVRRLIAISTTLEIAANHYTSGSQSALAKEARANAAQALAIAHRHHQPALMEKSA